MQRLIILLLLTITLIPAAYSFNDNKRVIDIYQEQLENLRLSHAKLERLSDEAVNRAADIKQLIAQYEAALETTTLGIEDKYQAQLKQQLADIETTTQRIEDKYQAQLEQLTTEHAETEAAYLKKLEGVADLADHHYHSARKTDTQIKSLLTELGQSAEQILKLTQLISTQQQQISALRQEMSALRQQISIQQQEEISALRQQVQHNRNFILDREDALQTFQGHSHHVYSVAFSADGRYALSGSNDNTLKLWDVSSGQEVRTFSGHTNAVQSVAFSADGRYALSGSADKTLKLWNVSNGQEVRTFSGHTSNVMSVAFSADGRYALSGSSDKTLKLWDGLVGLSNLVE